MPPLTTLQLLPTIVIVALLGFFIVFTFIIFLWYRRQDLNEPAQDKPRPRRARQSRKMTLQNGKAIPIHQAIETPMTRRTYSLETTSPAWEKHFDYNYDVEKALGPISPRPESRQSRRTAQNAESPRGTLAPAQLHEPHLADPVVEPPQPVKQVSKQTTRVKGCDSPRGVPRPSIVTIERKLSSHRSSRVLRSPRIVVHRPTEPKTYVIRTPRVSENTQVTPEKRKGIDIAASLYKAYKSPSPLRRSMHDTPKVETVKLSPARTVAHDTREPSPRTSIPNTTDHFDFAITPEIDATTSPRRTSSPERRDSVETPAPLFFTPRSSPPRSEPSSTPGKTSRRASKSSPSKDKAERAQSPESEQKSSSPKRMTPAELPALSISPSSLSSPTLVTPPPTFTLPPITELRRSRSLIVKTDFSKNGVVHVKEPDSSNTDHAPSITISIPQPELGSMTSPPPTPPPPPSRPLTMIRAASLRSTRSCITVASSEVSVDWTIGNAERINFYPSLDDGVLEDADDGASEPSPVSPTLAQIPTSATGSSPSSTNAITPFLHRNLSKRLPVPGRVTTRDKALPVLPKSPLSQHAPVSL